MVDIKFQHFEKRRKDNIATVIRERQLIIARLQAAEEFPEAPVSSAAQGMRSDVQAEAQRLRAGV